MVEAGLHLSSKSPESLLFASFHPGMTLGIPEVPPKSSKKWLQELCSVLVMSIAVESWVSRLTFTTCPGTFVILVSGICFLASPGIAFPSFNLETFDADLILESSWRCKVDS